MLTYEQIITLSDKGFSPEQIVKLIGEKIPQPVPETVPGVDPEESPEQNLETPAQIISDHEENSDSGSLSSVLEEAIKGFSVEVAEMRKALQASNIRTVIREDIPPSKSADDVLAELIHPTINKEVSNK